MSIDWEREKQKAWARRQKEVDFYPDARLKKIIKDDLSGIVGVDTELRLMDYEGMLEDKLLWAKRVLMASYLPKPKPKFKTPQNLTENRRPGIFKKQLYLVRFVILQQVSSKKQRNRIRKRINWQEISNAWNTDHPNDPKSPKALKKAFYRAITENDVQQEIKKEMGGFTFQLLWYCRVSQVFDDADLAYQWGKLFSLREGFNMAMGKPLDDQQQALELEAIKNPECIEERLDETLRKGIALIYDIDLDKVNRMSREDLVEMCQTKNTKGEAQNE